jgi:capsular exopolysaccharide synthesis family protein
VTVDSPAVAPAEPNVDKRMKYLALTGVMSLFLGIGAAFTRHRLDSNVYDPVEVIDRLGMPLLGSVQNLPGLNGSAITRDDRLLESMRVISTALISPGRPRQPHSRLITSPTRGVGKSTVASHLARSLAVTDRRVLLIDADNYGQSSTRQFGMSRAEGLKEFLEGKLPQNKVVQPGPSDNLYILPAGERIGHFGELLARQPSQERIRSLFAAYDEVILDSPPVLASSVAIVLATLVDDIVLVLRAGKSTQEEVRAARQHLLMVGGRIVGAVLNGVDGRRSAYAYPYEYGYQVDDG